MKADMVWEAGFGHCVKVPPARLHAFGCHSNQHDCASPADKRQALLNSLGTAGGNKNIVRPSPGREITHVCHKRLIRSETVARAQTKRCLNFSAPV